MKTLVTMTAIILLSVTASAAHGQCVGGRCGFGGSFSQQSSFDFGGGLRNYSRNDFSFAPRTYDFAPRDRVSINIALRRRCLAPRFRTAIDLEAPGISLRFRDGRRRCWGGWCP